MQGWSLPNGKITKIDMSDAEIWKYFNILFSNKSKNQSSYKYAFIRSILENLYNVDSEIQLSFAQIYEPFARIYWNLVIRHGLRQSHGSSTPSLVETELLRIKTSNSIPKEIAFDKLTVQVQNEVYERICKAGKRYVVGAVYADTDGTFYEFDLKKEFVKLNPYVHTFMLRHMEVLFRLNNYELMKLLYKLNPPTACENLIENIENITQRNMLATYRQVLLETASPTCFYCGKDLRGTKAFAVDHFIPWSFVHSDNLWNLVLACNKCNSSKSDKLTDAAFLKKIIARNKLLLTSNEDLIKNEMIRYSESKLQDLYSYAKYNGFSAEWKPSNQVEFSISL